MTTKANTQALNCYMNHGPIVRVLAIMRTKNLTKTHSKCQEKLKEIETERAKERESLGGGDKKSGKVKLPYPIKDSGQSRDKAAEKVANKRGGIKLGGLLLKPSTVAQN